MFVLFLLVFQN